ncbi:iron-siderophore ABC transporter substrate-binding protein [Haloechinothrix sp. YIM 98757]|uniref:Iron-siderophore ABC transporter substrate-binding protein n=1 Tax=Haloechinothrix aidingensis TaxID=2752311 RepID=A0A838ACZ5_9PSEU|nr:iron-siderophore ABC transporter substrate-binding protein [Haloechinothrix aidingensis]MBA0127156.1 iron-siderophore ABC transporter substrate-binding protein [Haloechinothrix aidingensis]
MNMLVRAVTAGGAAVALALSAGCGSGSVADPGAEETTAESGSISVATAKGDVELSEPATDVVSLEWSYTEELLALGVTPVGVADSEAYGDWVSAPGAELPDDVTDVGSRQEPSIEKIKQLDPDVIVSDVDRLEANFDQLNDIAPVLAFQPTDGPALETMRQNFGELAKAVGKQDEADEVLADLDDKVDEVEGRLDDAGEAGSTFALAQGFTAEGSPGIRMFTGESLAGTLIESVGLENGWSGEPDDWGMTTVGVESLTQVDSDATFLYIALEDDDPFTGALADNEVWTELPFVAEDRVRALDPGTWVFGGPLSAMQLLDETAAAFEA